jgi:hypothetical protein
VNRITFVLALAAVALISATVPIAQGTSDSVPSRLAAAERKIAKLQRDVAAMRGTLAQVATVAGCLDRPVPVTVYGGNPTDGYVFRDTVQNREFLTSALDVTDQGDTPTAILATVNARCATALARTGTRPALRLGSSRR